MTAPTLDVESAGEVEPGGWRTRLEIVVLVAAVLAMTSGPVFRARVEWIGPTPDFNRDPVIQAVFVIALLALVIVAAPSWRRLVHEGRVVAWAYGALAAILFVSTLWSINRGWTFVNSSMFLLGTAAFALAGAHFTFRQMLWSTWGAMQIGVVLSALAWQLEWRYAVEYRGWVVGIYFNRNFLGLVAVIGMLTSIALLVAAVERPRSRPWLIAAVSLALVLDTWIWRRTDSATPASALAGSLVVVVLVALATAPGEYLKPRRWVALVGALVITLAVAAVVMGERLASLLGRSPTFTGRTTIWSELLPKIGERPILGWGFTSVWYDDELRASLVAAGRDVFKAHNGYLEVLAGAGSAGAVALAAALVCTVVLLAARLRREPSADAWWLVMIVSFVLLVNLGETYIGAAMLPWFLLVAVGTQLATDQR